MATTPNGLAAGAANCVLDCAGVQAGQSLIVVSETGAVEPAVVDAIVAAGTAAGATVTTVWADPIAKDAGNAIPAPVLAAYRDADVLISHFPTLKREALVAHFGSESRVRVPNRARTTAMLASDWARFPYSLQRVLAARLDAIMAPGRTWRVTAPSGTDVSGTFGRAGGLVGAAFFVESEDEGRARRNFPGGVHSPRTCDRLEGQIFCDYLDNVTMVAGESLLSLAIEGASITCVEGGTRAMADAVAASDGWIDSWHAGVHPRTQLPMTRTENARQWFSYSHCSPDVLHFHLGRTHETTNIGVFGPTLMVDGQVLYKDGQLCTENDPAMARAVAAAGIDAAMLRNRDIGRWS